MATRNQFSDLLWMPHSQHKVSNIWEKPNNVMSMRHHRISIPYHPLCRPALENLGFYQIVKMKEINIDKFLISALVERWRPETNTFHLPVGEMTVTLQDISCLWGLPIQGKPIIGQSDAMWSDLIQKMLGIPLEEQQMKHKKRKKEDLTVVTYSQYSINLTKLRQRFSVMPVNPTQEQVDWHTRALALEILGSLVFPDTSGDGVPAMYLQFLENLEQPSEYNWGGAALAMLYRQLSIGAEKERSEISGPLLVLQLWSWSRLPFGRPINLAKKTMNEEEQHGEEDGVKCCSVYGAKWCAAHEFPAPHNAGIEFYRNQIELIREGAVNWEPYDRFMEHMPIQVRNERAWWFARLPLIHFWIVEFHYPDRVMRQFGRRQTIPPSHPQNENELRKLHKVKHSGGKVHNWGLIHKKYTDQYKDITASQVQEEQPFDLSSLPEYRRWFQQHGMYTVFLDSQCLGGLDEPIPYPRDNIEWTGYMPSGPPLARIGLRGIKSAAWGIKCAVTTGYRNLGKSILRTCLGNLRDLNLEPRLQNMLREAGLPIDIEDIESEDVIPTSIRAPSPPRDTNLAAMDDWIYSQRGFRRYIGHNVITTDVASTSQDDGQLPCESINNDMVTPRQTYDWDQPLSHELDASARSPHVVDWTSTMFSNQCHTNHGVQE